MIQENPLIDACKSGVAPEHIRYLAMVNQNLINLPGRRKRSPLMWACLRADPDAAAALIQMGADIETRDICGMTSYLLAAQHGRQDMMHMLHARGADIYAENAIGENALMLAAAAGHAASIAVGLSHNISPYDRNRDWETPLDIAKRRGHIQVVALLIGALQQTIRGPISQHQIIRTEIHI